MNRDVFHALADPTRRAILMSLKTEKQNVNSIAEQFDITRQAVSLHVKYLQECGVIRIQQEGRQRVCELELRELSKVDDWLKPFKEMWEGRFRNLDALLNQMKTKES